MTSRVANPTDTELAMSESESPTTEYSSPLDADGPLDADALRAIYSAEMGGEAFYEALAAHIDNADARSSPQRLAGTGAPVDAIEPDGMLSHLLVDPSVITLTRPTAFFQRLIDGEILETPSTRLAEHEPTPRSRVPTV
jgi:hypothetical protein